MKHALLMLIGCGLPLLLLFILPGLGVGSEVISVVFIIMMIGCHLMHFSHLRHGEGKNHGQYSQKGDRHEQH